MEEDVHVCKSQSVGVQVLSTCMRKNARVQVRIKTKDKGKSLAGESIIICTQ